MGKTLGRVSAESVFAATTTTTPPAVLLYDDTRELPSAHSSPWLATVTFDRVLVFVREELRHSSPPPPVDVRFHVSPDGVDDYGPLLWEEQASPRSNVTFFFNDDGSVCQPPQCQRVDRRMSWSLRRDVPTHLSIRVLPQEPSPSPTVRMRVYGLPGVHMEQQPTPSSVPATTTTALAAMAVAMGAVMMSFRMGQLLRYETERGGTFLVGYSGHHRRQRLPGWAARG